jgi:hypothetical protein
LETVAWVGPDLVLCCRFFGGHCTLNFAEPLRTNYRFCVYDFRCCLLIDWEIIIFSYESAFFLAIGIEGFFAFMVGKNLHISVDQLFVFRDTVTELSDSGLEPMLLILEALGFTQIDRLRQAQREFHAGSSISSVDAKGPTHPRLSTSRAAKEVQNAMAPFGALNAMLSRPVAAALQSDEGSDQANESWTQLTSGIGLPSTLTDTAATRQHAQSLAKGMVAVQTVVPALQSDGTLSDSSIQEYTEVTTQVLTEWSALVGIDDQAAIEECTQVLLPQFLQKKIPREKLSEFLRSRLQLSESVRLPLVTALEWAGVADLN